MTLANLIWGLVLPLQVLGSWGASPGQPPCGSVIPAHSFIPLFSFPIGFAIYFGYGVWHSEEASLAAGQAKTPDSNLDQCK